MTRKPLWRIALFAFVAMCIQDMLATAMVFCEAHSHAWEAGIFDSLNWFAMAASTGVAYTYAARYGWTDRRTVALCVAITAANFAGTFSGVSIASHLIGR